MGALKIRREGHVLELTLSNPGRANALDFDILAALDAQVRAVAADAGVRLVLLRGTAGGCFSSGADIRQWSALSPQAFGADWIAHGLRIFRAFEALRCPTVAVVEGVCFGGGLELALCADLRVASTQALFSFPEVGLGAFPGWEGGARLARIAGRGRALEAVLTARRIDAATALDWGLVSAVWPPSGLETGLAALAGTLTTVSPAAAATAKAAILGEEGPAFDHPAAASRLRASADAETGLQAFLQKQPPRF